MLFFLAVTNAFGAMILGAVIAPQVPGQQRLVSYVFAGVAIAAMLVFGFLMTRLRCPRCGHPAMRQDVKAFGVRWTYWGALPEQCARCGQMFDGETATSARHR